MRACQGRQRGVNMRDFMITSSVLTGVVLMLRYLAKGRLNPIVQYALWIPVMLRLLIPVPWWDSRFSVLNLVPDNLLQSDTVSETEKYADIFAVGENVNMETGGSREGWGKNSTGDLTESGMGSAGVLTESGTGSTGDLTEARIGGTGSLSDTEIGNAGGLPGTGADNSINTGNTAEIGAVQKENGVRPAFFPSLKGAALFIWAAGALSVGGYMLFYQIKWKKYLRANRKPLVGREIYRNGLSVYTVKNLPSPCLTGNCIYLTKEMAGDEKRLEHILAHEYCHYRHLDFLWVSVRCVLVAVYWFHPLVWAAAWASKQDSELACDAAAIRLLGEQERLAYGKTLLALIAESGCDFGRMGIASTMSGGEKGIRERISRIAGKPKYMAATAGIVLLLAAAAVFVTFSGAAEKESAEAENMPADGQKDSLSAESGNGWGEEQLSEELQALAQQEQLSALEEEKQQTLTQQLEQLRALEEEKQQTLQQQQEAEQQFRRLEQELVAEVKESAVLQKLASYDGKIEETGSRAGVYAVRDALNCSDYIQTYYENGETALDEGMYLLEVHKGSDGSDIKIYGMYSKEYGCEGVKILIGDDANDFDVVWRMSYFTGQEENLRLYEAAEDGMPRTFAWKALAENTSETEIWDLYVCDRYDTGTIEQYTLRSGDIIEELRKRLRFEIHAEECRIYVYDKDKLVGYIPVEASPEAMKSVQDVIMDGSAIAWELGSGEDEIRMMTSVGLLLSGSEQAQTEKIWYYRLPILSFPVTCGTFGERTFQLGQASVDTGHVNAKGAGGPGSLDEFLKLPGEAGLKSETQMRQDGTDVLSTAFTYEGAGEGHYDVLIQYTNPCPSYTRISDAFGTRSNPVTGDSQVHNGVDLAAEKGADIVAAADGTVYQTGFDAEYGNYIVLYHVLNGEFTYYAGCQDVLAAEGESVAAGQKIATVGSTGRSTGPHLHFARSRAGEYIEPEFE